MPAAQGYIGRNPADSSTVIARQSFSPTGIQTDFTFAAGYSVGYVDLYLNGARLIEGQDFTATDGSTVGLTTNAVNGDVLEVVAFKAFNASNVSAAGGNFTVSQNLTVSGTAEVTGAITATGGVVGDATGLSGTPDITVRHLKATGISTVSDTTQSTTTTSGALIVSGGLGVAKNLFVGGSMNVAGTLTYEDVTNSETAGITTTGGLVVTGLGATFGSGVGIADSIYHIDDDNTAIRFPAADTFTVETSGSEALRVNQYGTLGVGCTPEDLQSGYDAVQIGGNLMLNVDSTGAGAGVYMSNNVYRDRTDSRWEYINTDEASQYVQANGEHFWRYAASGTADTAITWSEALRIDSSGRLLLGTTTEGHVSADDLTVAGSGDVGITIRSGTGSEGSIMFSDGTSGNDEYRGWINYNQSSNFLRFFTNATEALRVDSSQRLVVGADASVQVAGSHPFVQHHGNKTTTNLAVAGYANNSGGSILALAASRSTTVGTPGTVVASGDILGDIRFAGDDGTDINSIAAAIRGEVDGAPGSNDMPGRLVFATTADGAASATERARIDSSGNMQVSTGQFTVGTTASSGIQMINDGTFGTINSAALTIRTNATTAMTVDTSQRLLIGATSTHGINANLQVRNDSNGHNLEVLRSNASANPARIWMGKSRGTAASPSAVNNSDFLGEVRARGYDGSSYSESASVAFVADATPSSGLVPGRIEFYTEDSNSGSFTERLRIDSVGTFHFKNGMMIENGSIGTTARNGTQNVDLDAGMVRYYSTASTGTWKPNFRVSSSKNVNGLMGTGDVISPTMIVAKGAASHYSDTIQVDGTDVTPEWLGGAPTATSGGGSGTFDVYSYTIIKTGDGAFKVFGSVSTYE